MLRKTSSHQPAEWRIIITNQTLRIGCAYIRVSTNDQTEYSLDAQIRAIRKYASENNIILSNEHIFIDEGISGKKAEKRPAFMKMISISKSKNCPWNMILVHRFDRFSRSREDSIVYKSLLRKECNIKVISITEQLEDDKFSVILEAMLEAMAEYYSLNLADEVIKGMTEKALCGGFQASPPLGYRIEHSGDIPVIIIEEAEIIKTIFNKYVNEGLSIFQIAKYLNNLNLKTKQNNSFGRRSIEYIIQNPIYKGYIRWNRAHKATNTIRDESEWIVEKGMHKPIISEEQFDKAQKRFKREYIPRNNSRPDTEYKHWLSGLVKCNKCGRSLTASNIKGCRYKYFTCNGYSKGRCSSPDNISEKKLLPLIYNIFEKVILAGKIDYRIIKKHHTTDTSILEKQLSKLEIREERVKEAYLSGIDNLMEYKHNKEIILKEKIMLQNQIGILKNTDTSNHKPVMADQVKQVYEIIANDEIDNITKSRAMKSIIDKIIYNKKDSLLDIFFYLN